MGGGESKPVKRTLEDTLIDVKLAVRQLEKQSNKCYAEEKKEIAKCEKAIRAGNKEGAQIFAQNAIQKKSQALNFLKLSSRFAGLQHKLETASKTQQMSKMIGQTIPQLDAALRDMTPEQLYNNMDRLDEIFTQMDVQTETMNAGIDSNTAMMTPASDVDSLIQKIGDEQALEVGGMLSNPPQHSLEPGQTATQVSQEDTLEARIAALK